MKGGPQGATIDRPPAPPVVRHAAPRAVIGRFGQVRVDLVRDLLDDVLGRLTRIVPQVRLLTTFDEPIEIIQSGHVESARVGRDPARLHAAALSGPYQDRAIIPRELRHATEREQVRGSVVELDAETTARQERY